MEIRRLRLVAALVIAVAGAPSPARAAVRPALTEVVEVRGTGAAAYVSVRLTRKASVTIDGVAATGGGRVAAAALVREPVKTSTLSLVAGRLAPGAVPVLLPTGETGFDPSGDRLTLPAGNYRLYAVTDGRPGTVRLRLRGLPTGTTRLTPRTATAATVADPAPTPSLPAPGRFAYSAGSDHAVRGPALHVGMLVVRHDAHALTDYWLCGYRGSAPSRPYAYAHGCPNFVLNDLTDQLHFVVAVASGSAMTTQVFAGLAPYQTGHYGNGAAFVTATPAVSAAYAHLWLTL